MKCSLKKLVSRKGRQLTGPDVGGGVIELESNPIVALQGNTSGQSVLRTKMSVWFLIPANCTRHYRTGNNNLLGVNEMFRKQSMN